MRRFLLGFVAAAVAWAANCSRTSVGFTPFSVPYARSYQGQQVSLYPNGAQRPAAHESLGLAQAAQVVPRDAAGNPDPAGTIVLLSVGMSNATMEFSAFIPRAMADPLRNPRLEPVDGAIGGMTAAIIASQPDRYWPQVDQRLKAANATVDQVQVIWLKEADANPTQGFPAYAKQLQSELATVVRQARARFPNLKIAYLSNRIYAGYASSPLNPEPYAYESGFSVKWLVEQQIGGDEQLSVAGGAAPWLAWGPDLWADGLTPRSTDGLTWACADVRDNDGTHPSASGQQKVARMLLDFFHSDSTARPWYLAPKGSQPVPAIGAVENAAGYGTAIATGSLATIFGTNLAGGTAQADGFPLPHELVGTRVEIDGVPALLYYVSPPQINFVVPATGGQSLAVVRGETASAAVKLSAGFWAPGLFTLDSAGSLAAEHADGTVISPAQPARHGETIQAFGTGLGIINPLLMIPVPLPVVSLAGGHAPVTYAGPAPGLPGVTQINFTIPADAPAGNAVPVAFQLGNATSNPAAIAIAAN